jgi:di/tricarboxylate transporter
MAEHTSFEYPTVAANGPRWNSFFASFSGRDWLALAFAIALPALIWWLPEGLSPHGRVVLIVFALAIVGWSLTPLSDTSIALLAVLTLAATGALGAEPIYRALGKEIVWLLIASFLIAGALKSSGLAEQAVMAVARRFSTVASLFRALNLAIAATALVIPSTSGRAALLLPVFAALAGALADRRTVRALALLFPTSILLSAGGSLIGAGAHFVALDYVALKGGPKLGYADWLALGMPLALLSSALATEVIVRLFLRREERARRIALASAEPRRAAFAWTRQRRAIAIVLAGAVGLWVTSPWHGAAPALVALAGATALTWPGVAGISLKEAIKSVEWELIVFLAATMAMGGALLETNAAQWLSQGLFGLVGVAGWRAEAAVALAAGIALLAHLLITSRTARATVLIPAVALPLAGLGADPTVLVLVVVMGTGFCQTMMASAKPVALYGKLDHATYDQADLARLSLALMPIVFALLLLFALAVWPAMGMLAAR